MKRISKKNDNKFLIPNVTYTKIVKSTTVIIQNIKYINNRNGLKKMINKNMLKFSNENINNKPHNQI